eukprot:TRINITY_DN110228_c0_g1_i1.p1 TRINITY_DN110228_c0_g1~~TRINITY_DN110228_c0_g1_i1.p1  ORF type:complete len:376 (-),score=60.51 TRINITY_DN110228_c0_g1_i1:76-1203(-)
MEALKTRPDDETTYTPKAPGSFQRGACCVQNWIEDPTTPDTTFPAEPNRYHLFVNYGCGWCHQVLQVRALRKLENAISITHVGCYRTGQRGTPDYLGWSIPEDADKSGNGFRSIWEVYNAYDRKYGNEQLTIPVLFDKKTRKVVSNDPAHMLLMMDFLAEQLRGHSDATASPPLYPEALRAEIEAVNAVVFPGVNNGVYCCWIGGMSSEDAFEEGFQLVQNGLKWMEERLGQASDKSPQGGYDAGSGLDSARKFLCGTPHPTLADVRAFPHVFRFDGIYWELMMRKKGSRVFDDFPHLAAWVRRMFETVPEICGTCDLQVATRFYFSSKPVEESDQIYDREREATGNWLPTREAWAEKRRQEGLTEAQIISPFSK